jgi:hypothetical protein
MFFPHTACDYSRHASHSRFGTADSRHTASGGSFLFATSIKILNSLQNQNIPEKFSTTNRSKHYFCLDTSLNRTLAYGHWYNWGNVLKTVTICSHSWLRVEIVSAACATTLHWISPSFECSGPVQYLEPRAGEPFFADTLDRKVWAGAAQSL